MCDITSVTAAVSAVPGRAPMSESVLTALPPLDSEYTVPAEAIAEYDEKGHTILRGLATPAEIAAYEPAIREAAFRHNKETRPIEERDDIIAKALLQIWN